MKKLTCLSIMLLLALSAWSQGWVYINGTVTDEIDSLPVVNHAVTILADSANGVIYYNVVFTDSAGFYFDEVPVMTGSQGTLYIQTLDCNNFQHEAEIVYDSVNTYFTQDFRICTSGNPCDANFTYNEYSNTAFQFQDLSLGDPLSWLWDFGDGTVSEEQNPLHAYPGPGTFEACLTITSNNCTDIYCATIVISDTVYQQIYGQVFTGNFPAQSAVVMLFALNPGGVYTPLDEGFPADSNGIYYFTLVPSGIYLIQAVPFDSNGYLPTYYGDVINWQQATQVIIGEPENPYNISLVQAGPMTPGPGSVSGQINIGKNDRSSVDKINMMLMNDSLTAISFSEVSLSGYFDFPTMDYGIYYLRAELSGVASDNMKIEITPENPHLDIILSYSGNSVLDVAEADPLIGTVSVYPNPVSERLNISLITTMDSEMVLTLYNITGQIVYQGKEHASQGHLTFSVPAGDLPAGIYTLRITLDNGMSSVRKVIKSR